MREVPCPYCGLNAELVDSAEVYGTSYGMVWLCRPCRAWVGVHKNNKKHKPLGTLANEELRTMRRQAHAVFDPFWQKRVSDGEQKWKARQAVYARLAEELGISAKECHIAHFDVARCEAAINACRRWQSAATEAAADKTETR